MELTKTSSRATKRYFQRTGQRNLNLTSPSTIRIRIPFPASLVAIMDLCFARNCPGQGWKDFVKNSAFWGTHLDIISQRQLFSPEVTPFIRKSFKEAIRCQS